MPKARSSKFQNYLTDQLTNLLVHITHDTCEKGMMTKEIYLVVKLLLLKLFIFLEFNLSSQNYQNYLYKSKLQMCETKL